MNTDSMLLNEEIEDYSDVEGCESHDNTEFQYNIDTYTNAIPVERLVKDFTSNIIQIPSFQNLQFQKNKKYKTGDENVFF